MVKTFNFDDFKDMIINDVNFKDEIIGKQDIIDLDNGTMTIYSENINKYLEQYACKNAEDLQDTLYYNLGIYCKII